MIDILGRICVAGAIVLIGAMGAICAIGAFGALNQKGRAVVQTKQIKWRISKRNLSAIPNAGVENFHHNFQNIS